MKPKFCTQRRHTSLIQSIVLTLGMTGTAGTLFLDTALAAPINWNSATTISGDTNVLNAGALNYAYTFSSIAAAPTVNSVLFTKTNSITTIAANVTLSGFTNNNGSTFQSSPAAGTWNGLTASYKGMLQGADYGGTGAATVTLQSLTSGRVYATQIWVNDSRSTGATRTETVTSTGGNTVTLDYNNSDANGGVGQFTTGRFVADAATQVFTLQGNASTQLNAFQVRDVTNIGNWVGTGGATWDASITNNFASNLFSAALATTNFGAAKAPLNSVTFADSYWNSGVATTVTLTNVTVDAAGVSTGTVYFDNSLVDYTIGNASGTTGITSTTAIVKNGSGTVTLNGANTHTGGTTITAGTLRTGVANALSIGNTALTITGGTLDLNGISSQQVSAFNGGGGTILNSVNGGTANLTVGGNNLGGTYSGTIADNSGGGATGIVALTKVGSATQILSGPNTHSGGTNLSGGVLQIGAVSSGSVGSITSSAIGKGVLTLTSGTLSSNGGTARTILNAVTFAGNITLGDSTNNGKLTFSAGLNLGAATRTMTLNSDVQLDGAFSNPGVTSAISKAGSGTLTINASNAGVNFGSGGVTNGFVISAGKVIATNVAAFGSAGQIVTLNGGIGTSAGSTVEFATDSAPNAYLLSQNSGNNGTVILNRATSGTAISYSMGVASLGQGNTVNVQKGGNVTDTPTLTLAGLALSAGSLGTTTLNPTTAFISITGGVSSTSNFAKTLQLDGTSTGNTIGGNITNGTNVVTLTKADTGTWTLTGTNGHTGGTNIKNGAIILGGANDRLPTAGSVVLGDVATSGKLVLGDTTSARNQTLAGLTATGLGGNVVGAHGTTNSILTLSVASGTNTFAGKLGGAGTNENMLALTKSGAGTLTLSGTDNSYSGVTTFQTGIVNIALLSNYGANGSLGNRTLASDVSTNVGLRFMGGTLQYTGGTAQTTDRAIRVGTAGGTIDASGSVLGATMSFTKTTANVDFFDNPGTRTLTLTGSNAGDNLFAINIQDQATGTRTSLTKTGIGTWVLTNANNSAAFSATTNTFGGYGGGTSISGGTLAFANNAIGGGVVNFTGNSTLRWESGNTQDISAGTGSGVARSLTISDGVSATFNTNGNDVTLSAAFGVGALKTGAVTKTGAGKLTISAANTYTGTTTVTQGTLLVNNTTGSGTGTNTVSVESGATLGGTGTISGAVNVTGVLSPGASIESLQTGALTMVSGSTFVYEVTNNTPTGADMLGVNGALSLTTATLDLSLANSALSGGGWTIGNKLTLISYIDAGAGITSGFAGRTDDTSYLFGSNSWLFNYNDTGAGGNYGTDAVLNGQNKFVTLTLVPEPSAALLAALGSLLALLRRKRA